jgi:peroxiredoxin
MDAAQQWRQRGGVRALQKQAAKSRDQAVVHISIDIPKTEKLFSWASALGK